MKFLTLIFLSLSLGLSAQQKMSTPTPEQGLIRLMEGNKRYMSGKMLHPDRSQERRDATAALQQPFAIILSCADSRVSPEIVFDQGIGDLFIVRDAGNVLGPVELDSIEFAALYLKASFILVMGHEECGAVKAVMAGTTQDIENVASLISPALKGKQGASVEVCVKANVDNVVRQLNTNGPLSKLIKQGKLKVRGAYYDFISGKVELLPEQAVASSNSGK